MSLPPSAARPGTALESVSVHPQRRDVILFACLWIAELAFVFGALSLHKMGDRALNGWVLSSSGAAFAASVVTLLVSLAWIGREYLRSRASGSRWFTFMVAMNAITVALILVPVELALRLFSRDRPDAPIFMDTVLLPRSWEKVAARNRELALKASGNLSYLVYDQALGWKVGPSRRSANGLYFSSTEGLRTASQGAVLNGPKNKIRVALVGDSYAFAEEVKFEDSAGYLLERDSGGTLEVLNFGVPGYGVDQSYLRFKNEALAWKPDIVILGFPMHDLYRTMTVYPFVNWTEWEMPFSKPRLVLNNGALQVLNVPTITPQAMFSAHSLFQLPFLEYDLGFSRQEWRRSVADVSYAKRWLFSRFPAWPAQNPHVSTDELVRVNGAIFRAFNQLASDNGINAFIVFFPDKPQMARIRRGETTEAQRILKRIGVPFVDTTPCVLQIDHDAAYVPGDPHFSPLGNAAVAKCISGALRPVIDERRTTRSSPKTTPGS
jgi:hypothetical protein